MFFTVLFMYSAFVLTSVHTNYYDQGIGKIFEYYVYIWAFGDFIEELISCFVSISISMTSCFGKKILFLEGLNIDYNLRTIIFTSNIIYLL